MRYPSGLLHRAFDDTWNLVFDRSFWSAMITLGILFGTFWFLRCRKQHEEAKQSLKDFGVAAFVTTCAFLFVFLLNALIFTPAALYKEERDARTSAENAKKIAEDALQAIRSATPAPTPLFHFQQTDREAREQVEAQKEEIAAQKKTLETSNEKIRELSRGVQPPRALTPKQRSAMLATLKQKRTIKPPMQEESGFGITIRHAPTLEAQNYAEEIKSVLKEAGWTIDGPPLFVHRDYYEKGLEIQVQDFNNQPDSSQALNLAFRSAGIATIGASEAKFLKYGHVGLIVGYPEKVNSTPPSSTPNTEASPQSKIRTQSCQSFAPSHG